MALRAPDLDRPPAERRVIHRAGPQPARMTDARAAVLRVLDDHGGAGFAPAELAQLAGVGTTVVRGLVAAGITDLADRRLGKCSGGEQQRVALSRAFVVHPSVLLADEPTGNLDPATADEIMDLLLGINRRGTTVVMSTHNARAVNRARKRVLELRNGVLVRDEHEATYEGEA